MIKNNNSLNFYDSHNVSFFFFRCEPSLCGLSVRLGSKIDPIAVMANGVTLAYLSGLRCVCIVCARVCVYLHFVP